MTTRNIGTVIAAGAIGNILEWYDFAIYGFFAPAIGQTFFPHADPAAQILSAFGIFAIGFLMRPIGAALIGQLGDHLGRARALNISIVMMAVPTCLVALLPGYDTIGIAAPIILTILRMVQGLSLGGECTTSMVFMVENAQPNRRGLVGAISSMGVVTGILLGSATGAVLSRIVDAPTLADWAWRIPFAAGFLVGLAGFALRQMNRNVEPTAKYPALPLVATIREYRGLIVRLACVTMSMSVAFNLMFVYIVSWLQTVDGLSPGQALTINTVSMIALLPVILLAGWASDYIGRRPLIMAATAFGVVAAVPLLSVMYRANIGFVCLGQLGFVCAVGILAGVIPAFMVDATPPRVRCTAIALGFNVTVGVVGGLSPLVATWLVYHTANNLSPAFLIMGMAAISFITSAFFFEARRGARVPQPLPPSSQPACRVAN